MNQFLAIIFLCTFASTINAFDASLDGEWKLYQVQFKKFYKTNEDSLYRRSLWEKALKYINKHNLEADNGKHTYRLKMNQFGDLNRTEQLKITKGLKPSKLQRPLNVVKHENMNVPKSIDWTKLGCVTSVKNQEQCGSCWAFAALGALECQQFKKTKVLASLSAQNLMDCSGDFGNEGCNGGLMDSSFDYIKANKGIDTDSSYPYEAQDGKCRFDRTNVGATLSSYVDVQPGNETELTNAVGLVGPVAVAVDGSHTSFIYYSSGIYYEPDCSSTQVDHSPLVVGYDSLGQGQDYYIVKNSWGVSWGNQGYILMSRNKNNNCGIATIASYPLT